MTLIERTRRRCPDTFRGRQCEKLEGHEDPCALGDVRWRMPAWLQRARSRGGLPALDLTRSPL